MATTPDQANSTNGQPTRDQLEAEIKDTRAELGATVAALSERMDVKARARQKIRSLPPAVPIGAAAAVTLLVAVVVWKRRS
jgi:hypothetical protein